MIVNHWAADFTKLYGHVFPESYLTLDTEHSIDPAEKGILFEIGHVLVENRQIVDRLSIVLDWTDHPIVPAAWVQKAIRRCDLAMKGKSKITWERMKTEGIKPEKALSFYHQLFTAVQKRGLPFVAHHGFRADEPMLRSNFEGFIGKKFSFGANGMIDTGAIEKASQCIESTDPVIRKTRKVWLPQPGDTLEAYFRRVVNYPVKGVLWRLELCMAKYGLAEKYDVRPEQMHGADVDALCVHYLMEQYRSMVTHTNTASSGPLSPTGFAQIFEEQMAKVDAKEQTQARKAREEEDEFEAHEAERPKRVERPPMTRRRGQRSL